MYIADYFSQIQFTDFVFFKHIFYLVNLYIFITSLEVYTPCGRLSLLLRRAN